MIPTESFSLLTPRSDEDYVIGGDPTTGNIGCWDLETGRQIWSCAAHADAKEVSCLMWGDKGDLITAGGRVAKLWGVESSVVTLKTEYAGHAASITTVAVTASRDPGLVVTACKKGEVKIWGYHSGECLKTVSHDEDKVECLAISGSDQLLASGTKKGTMSVWSLDKDRVGDQIATTWMGKDSVICALFTKDERHVITGLHQGKQQLFLWDYNSADETKSKR